MNKLVGYLWEPLTMNTNKNSQDKANMTSKHFQSLEEYEKALKNVAIKIQDLQKSLTELSYDKLSKQDSTFSNKVLKTLSCFGAIIGFQV